MRFCDVKEGFGFYCLKLLKQRITIKPIMQKVRVVKPKKPQFISVTTHRWNQFGECGTRCLQEKYTKGLVCFRINYSDFLTILKKPCLKWMNVTLIIVYFYFSIIFTRITIFSPDHTH